MTGIKSTLKQNTEIDAYKLYNKYDIEDLIVQIDDLLRDDAELLEMRDNTMYTKNVYDLVRFIYTKVLSETEEKAPSTSVTHKQKLLSTNSLNNLYSFAV